MEIDEKVKCGRNSMKEDRISNLPRNIQEHILDCMPLRDAVGTSTLSKKWKYIWTTSSNVIFDNSFHDHVELRPVTFDNLLKTIYKVLLLHSGSILKFVLQIKLFEPLKQRDVDDINQIILFLSSKGVKDLTLDSVFVCGQDHTLQHHMLPSHLFDCQDLNYLRLCMCSFSPTPMVKGFPNLITLELSLVTFPSKCFVLVCQQLERLSLYNCSGYAKLHICSSHQSCHCGIHGFSADVTIRTGENIREICISSRFFKYQDGMIDISGCFPNIRKLHVDYPLRKFLPTGSSGKITHLSGFEGLKKLKITLGIDRQNSDYGYYCPLCLIRKAPNLVELQINAFIVRGLTEVIQLDCGASDCSMKLLKSVKFSNMKGSKVEMSLIEYLLLRCPVLEEMLIQQDAKVSKDKSSKIQTLLLSFPRASSKSKIIYMVEPENI